MIPQSELLSNLAHYTSTTQYFKHWLNRFVYTDEVQYLAKEAQAYWLLDVIASHQTPKLLADPMLKDFQIWKLKLTKHEPHKEVDVICERDTDDIVLTQHIDYTDFPLDAIKLYLENGVLMLPSERFWMELKVNIEEIEFDFNLNEQERDNIIGQAFDNPPGESIRRFSELSLDKLQELVDKKFADSEEYQNSSPTIAELLEIGKLAISEGHQVTFGGYTCDYMVGVDAINIRPQTNLGNDLAQKFAEFEFSADEFTFSSELLTAWWD